MALSTHEFWESYYDNNDLNNINEWYVNYYHSVYEIITILNEKNILNYDDDEIEQILANIYHRYTKQPLQDTNSIRETPALPNDDINILHNGCGISKLGKLLSDLELNKRLNIYNVDVSVNCINELKVLYPTYYFEVGDAKDMSYLFPNENIFDVIIDKGLFDSITANQKTSLQSSIELFQEGHRVLKTNGIYLIFSTFEYNDNIKPMKLYLDSINHLFNIETKRIHTSPLEFPDRDHYIIYILTKITL